MPKRIFTKKSLQNEASTTSSSSSLSAGIVDYLQHQQYIHHQHHQAPQFASHITQLNPITTPPSNLKTMSINQSSPVYESQSLQPPNSLEKTYYTTIDDDPPGSSSFFTTGPAISGANEQAPPNTILITNNFTQQQHQAPTISTQLNSDGRIINDSFGNSSIRIVNTHNNSQRNSSNDINNININNKGMSQDILQMPTLQTQNSYYHRHQQPTLHHLQHIQNLQQQQQQQQQHQMLSLEHRHYPHQYISSETTNAIQNNISTKNNVGVHDGNAMLGSLGGLPTTATSTSTVVLDRINICINNHYSDTVSAGSSSLAASQPSPVIPAIQHKPIERIENGISIDPYGIFIETIVIEPDSTTTPNTPPTTPESASPTFQATRNLSTEQENSPITTSTSKDSYSSTPASTTKNKDDSVVVAVSKTKINKDSVVSPQTSHSPKQKVSTVPKTPLTPTSPTFSIGEDAFLKRRDGRFYLGRIADSHCQRYLVQFDDKSDCWSNVEALRKLNSDLGYKSMCVACKQADDSDIVEICERCCRGYHRKCTVKTACGLLICKRCNLPMIMEQSLSTKSSEESLLADINPSPKTVLQLPYELGLLNWDEKHRVNLEQVYCYCGQFGQFDNNMLQCCKCKQWFHFNCLQCIKVPVLRGDCFFVFCCSVCNNGREFIRRLELKWDDLVHVIMYNLSVMKHRQKYHHLKKDILPFVLQKRSSMNIAKTMCEMSYSELKQKILSTLTDNPNRFQCGKDTKKDKFYWGLRKVGPPILPEIVVNSCDTLSNKFIIKKLGLILLEGAPENEPEAEVKIQAANKENDNNTAHSLKKLDKNEFKINDNKGKNDDEKFESDDEIPIKRIIEKERKRKLSAKSDELLRRETINPSENDVVNDDVHKKGQALAKVFPSNNSNTNCPESGSSVVLSLSKKSPLKSNKFPETKSSPKSSIKANLITPTATKANNQKQSNICQTLSDAFVNSKSSNDNECRKQAETSLLKPIHNATNKQSNVASTTKTIHQPQQASSQKRKAFTLSKSYKDTEGKPFDCSSSSRICDSSSDENSSSSRGALDLIIPPPENFLGLNNPFRIITPKKGDYHLTSSNISTSTTARKSVSFSKSIKDGNNFSSGLDFSLKLAAIKSTGVFPNLSNSDLAKAAGQPRLVRTIKRRLSAKDITIGPNQEVRRRRTRRLSSAIEVISQTTINPIASNFFPIHAKDLVAAHNAAAATSSSANNKLSLLNNAAAVPSSSSASTSPPASSSSLDSATSTTIAAVPKHGRRLRQRPDKSSPNNSRRNSISGAAGNLTLSTSTRTNGVVNAAVGASINDLKQSVNRYFGAANRIEHGEQFNIRAKRKLSDGRTQYLIEWGGE